MAKSNSDVRPLRSSPLALNLAGDCHSSCGESNDRRCRTAPVRSCPLTHSGNNLWLSSRAGRGFIGTGTVDGR